MSSITILPGRRKGRVSVPLSKSHLHRLMIADYLSGGKMYKHRYEACEDVSATQRCLEALGSSGRPVLDCGESGSTLRFMLPLASALSGHAVFLAGGRLPKRPIQPFLDLLRANGVNAEAAFPLRLEGTLRPGCYEVPGNVSSQIVTGLLFALPLLDGDSRVHCNGLLQSKGYVDMTVDVLKDYGISIEELSDGYAVRGRQEYVPHAACPELDWSSAAFWLAMNEMGNRIELPEMNLASRQPDKAMLDLARQNGGIIDVSQCPDLFPALAALAASRKCTTRFIGVERLRMKESDRLAAMADVLGRLDVQVVSQEHFFEVLGTGETLPGGVELSAFNDHRIAMAAAVLASICRKSLVIDSPECVAKSYPEFFTQFQKLSAY